MLWVQGISRHSDETIVESALRDWRAILTVMGDGQFFFGDEPTGIDAVVFGALATSVLTPIERNRMSKATSGYFPRSRMSWGLSSGADSRDPAAHARLIALRGAETNFRVRNCRRFHLKALDHLVLLIVFLLRR